MVPILLCNTYVVGAFPHTVWTCNCYTYKVSMAKSQKRMASINLSDEVFGLLTSEQKRTGLSRKELISMALMESANKAQSAPIVRFKLTEPLFLMELRRDVISLEAIAKNLRFRIHKEKNKDPTQLPAVVLELHKLKEVVEGLQTLETVIREKRGLLDGLTASDYEGLKQLPTWLTKMRRSAEAAPDKAKRLARYDLIERVVRLLT